jgi:isopenicillin N synthase-like dioxygenase
MEPIKDPTMSDPLHADSRTAGLEEPAGADRPDFDQIPLIDFAGMLGTDAASKAPVAAAVRDACTNVGFFYVSNHGVPAELIATIFAQAPRFFGRPLADKMRWHVKNSSHFLGYVAMRDENANPAVGKGDLHEAFDFVPDDVQLESEFLAGDFRRAGNLWPEDMPGFRDVMTRYGIETRVLAKRLFAAFALALELPENYFASLSSAPMALIRLLHYPSTPGPFNEAALGTGAHTDHECFTILCQDGVQALQVRNRRGVWIDAPPIPGTFVVNIGDLMARWTNGIFASTYHRVANMSGRARYSLPCFIGANADAVIEALPSCVSPDRPAKYPPVIAGEYVSSLIYHQFHDNQTSHPLKNQTNDPPAVS